MHRSKCSLRRHTTSIQARLELLYISRPLAKSRTSDCPHTSGSPNDTILTHATSNSQFRSGVATPGVRTHLVEMSPQVLEKPRNISTCNANLHISHMWALLL